MASVNKVILIGNVGGDPTIRVTPSGDTVANFSIATTDVWKDKNGQKQEKTEWHRLVAYRKLAEIIRDYVKTGSSIYIEGRLVSNKYTDKNGIDREAVNINIEELRMLGSKNDKPKNNAQNNNEPHNNDEQPGNSFDDFEDDIPF